MRFFKLKIWKTYFKLENKFIVVILSAVSNRYTSYFILSEYFSMLSNKSKLISRVLKIKFELKIFALASYM
jgi:hypothetical protein